MRRFSELGVSVEAGSNIFQVQQVSITDILNSEIEVLDYEIHTVSETQFMDVFFYSTENENDETR